MPLINFSGLASGIDSEALIEATSDAARAANVTPKEDEISDLTNQNDALEELRTLLGDFSDLADGFRTLSGGALSKLSSSTDETVATATASNAAVNTTFTVTTTTIAQTGTWSTDDSDISDPSAAIAPGIVDTGNDTIDFDIGTGSELESISITIDATTSLNDIAGEFNDNSTKGVATVVNVGTSASPEYRLVVNTLNEGTLKGNVSVTVGSDITTASRFTTTTTDNATDATFSVSGISGTITRSTNQISDVFEGITLTLSKASSQSTISITDDIAGTSGRVQELVDKFNETVEFIRENNLIQKESDEEDALNVFGPLAAFSLDDNALSAVRSVLSSSNTDLGSAVRIFADLGVTTEQDGTLAFDTDVFETSLASEPSAVGDLLEVAGDSWGALTVSGGVIDPFTRFNGLFDIAVRGNKTLIEDLNDNIARAEESIRKNEALLRQRFARLEATVGKLQNQQQALNASLVSLGV